MPKADDLFRPTVVPEPTASPAPSAPSAPSGSSGEPDGADRRPTGRVRHDEKITVYVSADELVDIEQARLTLRRDHGLSVDRGRLVREAVGLILADLESRGADSMLVARLNEA
ncbi:MAG: hypothetical protein ACSLEW_07750 [Nocardioides sp.]